MEKVKENELYGEYFRAYDLESNINNVLDIINMFEEAGIYIIGITIKENAERDMQVFNDREYSSNELREKFDYIQRFGVNEMKYDAYCEYNGVLFNVNMWDNSNHLVLITKDANFELSDIIEKKSELGR